MKEIEKMINAEVDRFINENPGNGNGTISGLSIRTTYIRENAKKLQKVVLDMSNEYLENNDDFSEEELIEIADNALKRFLISAVNR